MSSALRSRCASEYASPCRLFLGCSMRVLMPIRTSNERTRAKKHVTIGAMPSTFRLVRAFIAVVAVPLALAALDGCKKDAATKDSAEGGAAPAGRIKIAV